MTSIHTRSALTVRQQAFMILAREAASLLPARDGRWRTGPLSDGGGLPDRIELRDNNRWVTLSLAEESVSIRGGGSPSAPVTELPHRFAGARDLAAAIARDHLRMLPLDPESDDHRARAELAALGAVSSTVARLAAARSDWSVSAERVDRFQYIRWERGAGSACVRIDDAHQVQLYVEGVRYPKLVDALALALPPADPTPVLLARPGASTVLVSAFPALWHDPAQSSTGPDDVLLGPGSGSVTVAVQIPPKAKPTRSHRAILTLECDLDLALMVMDVLA
ncbi:hypothetical protein [Kitasatospora sp. NPDC088134]|uniref:hypothetical protein n=1 Tax=Kitasatospora sp. NPDC088134 TaxID=3364071 RepID=UPI0037FAB50F